MLSTHRAFGVTYYCGLTHMVSQHDGKATAQVISLTDLAAGKPATVYLSLFDAMNVASIEGDTAFAAHLLSA